MITVKEKLMAQAATDAERDLIAIWMDEDHDKSVARQRAWQQISARGIAADLRFRW